MTDARTPSPAEDWITIWHSELAAMATDRELHEAMQRGIDAWAAQAQTAAQAAAHTAALLAAILDPPRRPGPDAPPRPPPPPAAPDGRDAELRRLHDRIAALERRLPP